MWIAIGSLMVILAVFAGATQAAGPFIVAHRGASADAPENTLGAFRLAWEQGADGIEGDFRLTADGRIVCIHDADTVRVAGQRLVVKDTNFDELKSLDVGGWKGEKWQGERVPTLEEVLAIVPAGKKIFIELKTGPEIVEPLAAVLANTSLAADQIVIISLDEDVVAACKQRMPQFKCHWLTGYKQQEDGAWTPEAAEVIESIHRCQADGLGTEAKSEQMNEEFVRQLRAAGINEFHVWTVDDPATARFYEKLGAWSITTNRPAKLRQEMQAP
jgi:glycerophosphoryl diester phosphodiesterase